MTSSGNEGGGVCPVCETPLVKGGKTLWCGQTRWVKCPRCCE